MDKFKWELMPVRWHKPAGCIVVFGYPLFGGWLPYIGFTEYFNTEEMIPKKCFLVEWFCTGIAIEVGNKDE